MSIQLTHGMWPALVLSSHEHYPVCQSQHFSQQGAGQGAAAQSQMQSLTEMHHQQW